ncbi:MULTISPECIES: serine/threonine-protein kinase [Sorangium]|uniref:Protein kinase n=1 Tax=Sorangium cellulosum TaxID=56 RepID=A0A4P2R6F3_SORCE|nr:MULTISPECIES: serine/threonine-protein kinase [Sorangium]AUX38398.1 protein kinase [Sorangium cellulosum]WCQ97686.1 serine-threonine kinase [Sorangium sp. Soce836]
MLGQVLDGKYTIVRLLGQGGMGSVYEAIELVSDRRVAIKVIRAEKKLSDDLVRRFRREAKAAMAAASPHIAQVLDAGVEPATGAPYMAMEYLAGGDLEDLLRRLGPLPPDLALRIVGQACMGVQHAHGAGIVHRDIKPANLFLAHGHGGEIVVKVLDFGIAKIRTDPAYGIDTTGLTSSGTLLGSPVYMSPEQARGIKTIDHRTDIWSLGVVLYRALTGRTPHQGADAIGALILAICTRPPPLVQDLAPWVPAEVAFLCHTALRIEADGRFRSAEAMLHGIRALTPEGLGLREDMLAPLTEAERTAVAHRLDCATTQILSSPSAAANAQPDLPPRDTAVASQALQAACPGEARVNPAPGPVQPGATPREAGGRIRRMGALGAALTLALGGAAVAAMALREAGARAGARPEEQQHVAQSPAAQPEAVAPASVSSVAVRISPQDASVEVDGVRKDPNDGAIELTGALGTVRRVRLFKDGSELVEEVVITPQGAQPGALELAAAAHRRRDAVENAPPSSAVVRSGIAPQNRKKKRVTVTRSPPAPTATAAAAPPPREITAPAISDIVEPYK